MTVRKNTATGSLLQNGSHPILLSKELTSKPRRVRAFDLDLVAFRDRGGQPRILDNRCPHRGASLHLGNIDAQDRIVCPYHGWSFDAQGRGESPLEPTKKNCNTTSYTAIDWMDSVWLVGDPAPARPADLPEEYEPFGTIRLNIKAPLPVVLDNFTENEHLPYVHKHLGGESALLANSGFRYEASDDAVEAEIRAKQRRSFIERVLGGTKYKGGDLFSNQWTTSFHPLKTRYLQRWISPRTGRERPLALWFEIYFIARGPRLTTIFEFCFIRRPKSLGPIARHVLPWVFKEASRYELNRDRKFLEAHTDIPESLHGMHLGAMDRPLIKIREKFGRAYSSQSVTTGLGGLKDTTRDMDAPSTSSASAD